MISISNDISTRLQALYHSGEISSYIHTNLPHGPLKTGWIEKGLLSKGMKGQLRDKHNQESLVIPADRFARLTRDMSNAGTVNVALIGSKGLRENKFTAVVYNHEGSQSLIAFQIQGHSPIDIVRLLLQGLGKEVSTKLDDPNLDYVEQMRMDSAERIVKDALVLSLPKEIVKISEWIKTTLQEESSSSVLLREGTSKELVVFSALLSRWINGLELFRETRSAIAACAFVKGGRMEVCFWDSSQKIASFATIASGNIEEISRKYLVPLWMVPGDSLRPSLKKIEVVLAPPPTKERKKPPVEKKRKHSDVGVEDIESLKRRLDNLSILDLDTRLKALESDAKRGPESPSVEKGSFDALQSRLADNIDRIEELSKRLVELEKRIRKIGSSR